MLNNILIFNIQRLDRIQKKKNLSLISFNEKIDLTKFCDDLLIGLKMEYKLYGIINHIGYIDVWNYYANIKIKDSWYEFNDSIVKPLKTVSFESDEI